MAIPRTPVTIATSDTFTTWLTNTNYAVDILKNIITDTVLTHASGAYTLGETVSQSATSSTGIVRVAGATTTTVVTTAGAFTTGSAVVGATSSVSKTPSAVSASHLATTNAVLTTPTITAPVIATITNNSNTLTLPTTGDTLVGRATTDTLTNKTLTSPTISGGTITNVTLTDPTIGNVGSLTVVDASTVGSVSAPNAMTIASTGIVTFIDDIVIKNAGTIGSATTAAAMTIASTGIVTFVDDIIIKNAGTIGSASDPDAIAIGADGDITLTQDLELQHDAAILSFGANDDVSLTHEHNDGLILKNTGSAGATVLTIQTSNTDVTDGDILGEIDFQAPNEAGGSNAVLVAAAIAARAEGTFTSSVNPTELVFNPAGGGDSSIGSSGGSMILSSIGDLTLLGDIVIKNAGTIGSASDPDAIAIGADGDITLTQDLELQHDAATISFGANDEVTVTHVHDTGLLLNSTMQLQFNDASQFINAPSATILDINATDEVEINATLADVNANLDVSGTYQGGGLMTTGGNIVIPNAGTIGSASDPDAISIASTGLVNISNNLTVTGGFGQGVLAKSANYTVLSTDANIFLVTTSTSSITMTLPAASAVPGKVYRFMKADSAGASAGDASTGRVIIARDGEDTIGINANLTMELWFKDNYVDLMSDGSSRWIVMSTEMFEIPTIRRSSAGVPAASLILATWTDAVWNTGNQQVPAGTSQIQLMMFVARVGDTYDDYMYVYLMKGSQADNVGTPSPSYYNLELASYNLNEPANYTLVMLSHPTIECDINRTFQYYFNAPGVTTGGLHIFSRGYRLG